MLKITRKRFYGLVGGQDLTGHFRCVKIALLKFGGYIYYSELHLIFMAKKKKAGRKPIADKAVRFIIYPRESWIKKVGAEKAKQIAESAIEKLAKK